MARVEVVPWSMASMCSGILAVLYRLHGLFDEMGAATHGLNLLAHRNTVISPYVTTLMVIHH